MATEGEIDVDPNEIDSAVGDDLSTYTQSLRSSVVQGVKENGRQYHSHHPQASYMAPEDEQEQGRLQLEHEAFRMSFDGSMLLAPFKSDSVHEVLDLGAGTGTWAIEFADLHPHANVTGVDLSAIQSTVVPPNCKFIIDDFGEPWLYQHKFDIIHGRMLSGSIADPKDLFRKSFNALAPGGWLEMDDMSLPHRSDDDTLPEDSPLKEWGGLLVTSILNGVGRDIRWTESYKTFMEEAGFINVTERLIKWPIGPWPKDPHLKLLGNLNLANVFEGLEGFGLRPLMGLLGMSREEVEALLVGVRKDLRNPKIHAWLPIYVVYGQKPESGTTIGAEEGAAPEVNSV